MDCFADFDKLTFLRVLAETISPPLDPRIKRPFPYVDAKPMRHCFSIDASPERGDLCIPDQRTDDIEARGILAEGTPDNGSAIWPHAGRRTLLPPRVIPSAWVISL